MLYFISAIIAVTPDATVAKPPRVAMQSRG
jgi:hypothetical protein